MDLGGTAQTGMPTVLETDENELSGGGSTDGDCGYSIYSKETFWYSYDPTDRYCQLSDEDVMRARATLQVHPQRTEKRFPEYDKVWEDDSLDVVAVFGIIASNTPTDSGWRNLEALLSSTERSLDDARRTKAPSRSGVLADKTVSGTINFEGRERRVNVTGILVQDDETAGSAFEERLESATKGADLVMYEGHCGPAGCTEWTETADAILRSTTPNSTSSARSRQTLAAGKLTPRIQQED